MANVFVPSANDPAVFTSDRFPLIKDGDGNTYRTVVKANVNGSIDVYSKGTGLFGGDELLFQYSATTNGVDFKDGKFKDKPQTAYNSFFNSSNANGTQFLKDTQKRWYQEAPPNAATRMASLDGYKSIAATTQRRTEGTTPDGPLTIQTPQGPITVSSPAATVGVGTSVAAAENLNKENESFQEKTRLEYGNVWYPENLSLAHQDCIKFSILKYRPSLASAVSGTPETSSIGISREVKIDAKGNPIIGKEILGTITLPIPAGINDSNTVSWQEDTLTFLQQAGTSVASAAITNGGEGATGALKSSMSTIEASAKTGELNSAITSIVTGLAVNSSRTQQRLYGSIFNNNLELLFNGPSLRNFSFTFKLSPRNPREAKDVMKIIRYFKQAMSVKRSQASLLLKTPHTFAISYLTSNKQHPYLNKFKECALTGFNVAYTPEGQYMTYMSSNIDERSMISYEISMSFQELEPVFDDEYGNESKDNILNIGY